MANLHRVKGLQQDYEIYGAFVMLRQWGAWARSGGKYVRDYRSPAGQIVVENVHQSREGGWNLSDEVAEMIGRVVDDIGERRPFDADALRYRFLEDLPYYRMASKLGMNKRENMQLIIDGAVGQVDEILRSLIYPRDAMAQC